MEDRSVVICPKCLRELKSCSALKTRPQMSLANGYWVGNVPECLSMLTYIEELFIGIYRPKAAILRLKSITG